MEGFSIVVLLEALLEIISHSHTAKRVSTEQDGDPGGIRTPDPQLRRLLLYPTELRGHVIVNAR